MKNSNSESKDEIRSNIDELNEHISELTNDLTQATQIRNKYIHKLEELEKQEGSNNLNKFPITMCCKSEIYDNIVADEEIKEICGITLNNPMKFARDKDINTQYIFVRSDLEMEKYLGESDIAIIYSDYEFGENKNNIILNSIANFISNHKK